MRWLALIVVASACGSGAPDISGIYMTTYHTRNDGGCTEGAAQTMPPYFRLREETFIVDYYSLDGCGSQDAATCDDGSGGSLFGSFFEHDGDGWFNRSNGYSYSGGLCTFFASEDRAEADDGEPRAVHIELRFKSIQEMLPEDDCTLDEAGDRADDLPCETLEIVDGVWVAEPPPAPEEP